MTAGEAEGLVDASPSSSPHSTTLSLTSGGGGPNNAAATHNINNNNNPPLAVVAAAPTPPLPLPVRPPPPAHLPPIIVPPAPLPPPAPHTPISPSHAQYLHAVPSSSAAGSGVGGGVAGNGGGLGFNAVTISHVQPTPQPSRATTTTIVGAITPPSSLVLHSLQAVTQQGRGLIANITNNNKAGNDNNGTNNVAVNLQTGVAADSSNSGVASNGAGRNAGGGGGGVAAGTATGRGSASKGGAVSTPKRIVSSSNGKSCCIDGCTSKQYDREGNYVGLSFFSMTEKSGRESLWKEFIHRKNCKKHFICELHFKSDDIQMTLAGRKKVKNGARPTRNLNGNFSQPAGIPSKIPPSLGAGGSGSGGGGGGAGGSSSRPSSSPSASSTGLPTSFPLGSAVSGDPRLLAGLAVPWRHASPSKFKVQPQQLQQQSNQAGTVTSAPKEYLIHGPGLPGWKKEKNAGGTNLLHAPYQHLQELQQQQQQQLEQQQPVDMKRIKIDPDGTEIPLSSSSALHQSPPSPSAISHQNLQKQQQQQQRQTGTPPTISTSISARLGGIPYQLVHHPDAAAASSHRFHVPITPGVIGTERVLEPALAARILAASGVEDGALMEDGAVFTTRVLEAGNGDPRIGRTLIMQSFSAAPPRGGGGTASLLGNNQMAPQRREVLVSGAVESMGISGDVSSASHGIHQRRHTDPPLSGLHLAAPPQIKVEGGANGGGLVAAAGTQGSAALRRSYPGATAVDLRHVRGGNGAGYGGVDAERGETLVFVEDAANLTLVAVDGSRVSISEEVTTTSATTPSRKRLNDEHQVQQQQHHLDRTVLPPSPASVFGSDTQQQHSLPHQPQQQHPSFVKWLTPSSSSLSSSSLLSSKSSGVMNQQFLHAHAQQQQQSPPAVIRGVPQSPPSSPFTDPSSPPFDSPQASPQSLSFNHPHHHHTLHTYHPHHSRQRQRSGGSGPTASSSSPSNPSPLSHQAFMTSLAVSSSSSSPSLMTGLTFTAAPKLLTASSTASLSPPLAGGGRDSSASSSHFPRFISGSSTSSSSTSSRFCRSFGGGGGGGASRSSESLSSPVERLEIDVVGGSPPSGVGSGEVFFAAPSLTASSTASHAFAMAFSSSSSSPSYSETVRSSTPMSTTPVYVTPSTGFVSPPSTASKLLAVPTQYVGKMTPLLIASSTPTSSVAPPQSAVIPAVRTETKNPLMVLAEAAALLARNDD